LHGSSGFLALPRWRGTWRYRGDVSRPTYGGLLILVAAVFASGCGSGTEKVASTGTRATQPLIDRTGTTVKQVLRPFYQHCEQTPGCHVARSKLTDTLPHDAVLEPKQDGIAGQRPRCGSFAVPRGSHWVTVAQRRSSCGSALRIMRSFWLRTVKVQHHGGKADAESWFTLAGFRGWRCYSAAGSGLCRKGQQLAMYGVQNVFRR
jgi:hypothetical protein